MFIERIQSLANEKGITIAKMLKDLNMGQGTFSTWKKRGSIPKADTVKNIADYFGVSTDYLLGKTDIKEKPADNSEFSGNINVRFLGRDGVVKHKKLTPELIAYLESIPDSNDDI